MGQIWLFDLPDVLRNGGLVVDEYPNWEARSRSSGGYDGIFAIQCHHTASDSSPANDMSYMWEGSPDEPVGAIYLARDGRATVGCAGATNTSGKGGPLNTSSGQIPLDSANRYVISIEAANNGVGEQWPQAQIDAYLKMVKALCGAYGIPIQAGDVHSHFEWTDRKIDPAGNSPYAQGGNKWDMNAFRHDVAVGGGGTPTPTPPEPTPPGSTGPIPAIPEFQPPTDWWLFPIDTAKPTIKQGSSDGSSAYKVTYLQCVIHYYAGGGIAIDGQFGDQTKRRVIDLQRLFGFPAAYQDGIVGYDGGTGTAPGQYATWPIVDFLVASNQGPAPEPPPTPEPPTPEPPTPEPPNGDDWMATLPEIKKGDSGPYVERMQHLLAAAGFMDPANVSNYDGQWGNGTEGAKARFDDAHGIGAGNTDCGPKSWESLMTGRVW